MTKNRNKRQRTKITEESLLRTHRLHSGMYARIAQKLGVDPSYVSRVAKGERQSQEVKRALLSELATIGKGALAME
ncbi:MAG: hypothetical protein DMG30_11180 [Acidobacteria bacterium]|nr:MAG: hypothetical protein DMG30_11180 [Acidobacteriota bacterium]